MPKKRKYTDINIQRTANGYYVYSHEDFQASPRVFEFSASVGIGAKQRALDYIAELLDTEVSNKK